MAIFDSENLKKDYILFSESLFNSKSIKYNLTPELQTHLKKYHRLTYIIALFDIKLRNKFKKEYNRYLFVSEILSDLLSNSVISILGFYNSSKILNRRFIENFYNHIYYFEHPIEYKLLNEGKNEYTPIKDLKDYYISHPVIHPQTTKDDIIKNYNNSVINQYTYLCKHVHTKGLEFMGLAKNLSEITPDINIVEHFETTNKTASEIVYLLYKFHVDIFFTNTEKTIITSTYNRAARKSLLL